MMMWTHTLMKKAEDYVSYKPDFFHRVSTRISRQDQYKENTCTRSVMDSIHSD